MNPRDFLKFFKTPSGRVFSFGVLFAGAAFLFIHLRKKPEEGGTVPPTKNSGTTNHFEKSQIVHTVERPMEVYRPPTAKPDRATKFIPTQEPEKAPVAALAVQLAPTLPLLPISLVADSPGIAVETQPTNPVYAPYGRLIPCETVITVDSASIQTPIIGLITEDIYHSGRLVIPAGTEVHGTAQTDRMRERISSGGSWTLVWRTGEELRLKGIALDREFASDQEGWGITDGSAGLRGRIIKSDDLAEIKLFAATLLGGAAAALTEKETTLFGSVDRRSINNAPLKGAQEVLQLFAQRIHEAVQRDGFYVRVSSGKQFYLYVLQTIDRTEAAIGKGSASDPKSSSSDAAASLPSVAAPLSDDHEHLPFPASQHP